MQSYDNSSRALNQLPDGVMTRISAHLDAGLVLRKKLIVQCTAEIVELATLLCGTLSEGGKVLLFGNGGSAADAQHFAAELTGRYVIEREALPAIALTTDSSALTAIGNDYGFEHVFARQIRALGTPKDLALAITTSGGSRNVILALNAAKELGLATACLTGQRGAALANSVDRAVIVPTAETAQIQECHIAIIHTLCDSVDQWWLRQNRPVAGGTGGKQATSAIQ